MNRKRVLLTGNTGRSLVQETMAEVRLIVARHAELVEMALEDGADEALRELDLALVVGGDGSILKAARRLAPAGVPAMGVNIGRLGFMAGFLTGDLAEALPAILAGGGRRSERMMLSVQIDKRDGHHLYETALNEVVVSHGANHRMAGVTVDINHETVATFHGDGVLVSTPTGSTAYNMAAGGPLLEPGLEAVVVTPICAHMLTQRAIVLGAEATITLRPTEDQPEASCIIDGQATVALVPDDVVRVRKSAHRFVLIENERRSAFDVLREKLHWSRTARFGTTRSLRDGGSSDPA